MFGYSAGGSYTGFHVWALNKQQMYDGEPSPQVVDFAGDTSDFTVIPANARLQTGTPPAGSPEYFVSTEQFLNALSIYKFHVDWDKISTSTFTGPQTQLAPNCWPNATPANASTTANAADVLAIRAMAQTQYSNIGGAESLWVDHTVQRNVSANNTTCNATTGGNATVRWYQANVTGGTVAANIVQGQTFDPEGANTFFRFMPSLAVDRSGDMAIGYTKSNATTNPQIKYAGRLAGDPVNTLAQTEQTLIDGTGAQSGNCGASTCIRWGDYSGMALDPNGCQFWMTGEYYATTGLNHQTRIGSFHYPGCTTVGNGTLSGTVTDGASPISGATIALGSRTTTTNGSGQYSFSVPAGTYPSLAASKPGFDPGSAATIAVPDGGTATRNFTLSAAAQSGCFTDNTQSTFQRGVPSNCDLVTNPGSVQLANPDNTEAKNNSVSPTGFGFTNTSWAGQTFTPTVSGQLKRVDVELFCSGCTAAGPEHHSVDPGDVRHDAVPARISATATIAGFNDGGAGGLQTFTFATPVSVTAGTRYAFVFRNSAAFASGTMAYTCSCATTGFADSNPYASGQRVTSSNSGASWTADTTVGGRDLNFVTYINPGFAPSGTFTSSLKDANPAAGRTPNWTTLTFAATTPAGTAVKFQIAASNNAAGPFSFVGPDGTASDVLHHERRQPEPVQRLPLPQVQGVPLDDERRGDADALERAGLLQRHRGDERDQPGRRPGDGDIRRHHHALGDSDLRRQRRERQVGRVHAQRQQCRQRQHERQRRRHAQRRQPRRDQRRLVPDRRRRLVRGRRLLRSEQRIELADREQGRPDDQRDHARPGECRLQHQLRRRGDRRCAPATL